MSACIRCKTTAGCKTHRLFTCASCGKLTHWNDGSADDRPNDCSACWVTWFNAMESIAVGLFSSVGLGGR